MRSTELIDAVQSYMDGEMSVPVQVSGGNDRPVPAVLIEDWGVSDLGRLQYVRSQRNEQGHEQARIYHVPYDADLDFLIRGEDAVGASELRSDLKHELTILERYPKRLSDHVARVLPGDGGGISYQYANPTETELRQTGTFTAAHVYVDTDVQPVTDIQLDVEIVQ